MSAIDSSTSTAVPTPAPRHRSFKKHSPALGSTSDRSPDPRPGKKRAPKGQSPERLAARARWSAIMWLPMGLLLLHRQNEVGAATDGQVNVIAALALGAVAVFGFFMNERLSGPHWPIVAAALVGGFLWGTLFEVLQDLPAARLASLAWFGCCSGQLRYHWQLRRLKRVSVSLRFAWNLLLRRGGLCAAFMAGETLGCALLVPRGWSLVSFSWYGYLLVVVLPVATFHFSSLVTNILSRVFGGAGGHVGFDASRRQVVYWVVTVALSVALLFSSVGYFLVNWIPYVWNQQLLMAPYGVLFELLSFRSRKVGQKAPTQGPYADVAQRYSGLIADVTNRSKDYHCH